MARRITSPLVAAVIFTVALGLIAQPAGAAGRESANSGDTGRAWVGTWATAPTGPPSGPWSDIAQQFENETLRQIVHTSRGGGQVRIRLSNEFGDAPLVIGDAHVARAAGDAATILPESDRRLTFSGRPTITIPPGAPALSDPVALDVPAGSDLAVSVFLPQRTPATTLHAAAFQRNYLVPGNATGETSLQNPTVLNQWYFLTGVSVQVARPGHAVVALGDSITDGANTTPGANHRYPDFLAARLSRDPDLEHLGVLNEGIGGNRLLHAGNTLPETPIAPIGPLFGESALTRFDRDVLAQPGARYMIVLLGINDIGHPASRTAPASEAVTAQDIIGAHRQLVARAHERGLTAIGATITPFEGDTLNFFTEEGEATRQAVNRWIRTSGEYDAVADFDRAVRDPDHPLRLLPAYDSGDHLHPNDAGMAAMADAVPLNVFRRTERADGAPQRRSSRRLERRPTCSPAAVGCVKIRRAVQ
ncbi:MAG TPA: SGNH/GDSL hydrolase family protein [Solirubrobacteraceae bacterium]|nr:SGNH/GDSL hydrolase family protein [Solirubrobacteraceae bacterium]